MNKVEQKNLGKLFLEYDSGRKEYINESNIIYSIPSYQRAYRWSENLSEIFFTDITNYKEAGYNFGFITLSDNIDYFEIIDGQQRLTTSYLIMLSLYNNLLVLNAGNKDLEEISKFFYTFPFKSTDSSTIGSLRKVFDCVKDKNLKIIITDLKKDDSSNPIYTNYLHINKILEEKYQNINSDSKKITHLITIFSTIINQQFIELKYESTNIALDSFISMNMKGQPLDSYDIFSALCLKGMGLSDMDIYKHKLNNIYKLFSDNKKVLGFKNFEHMLKTMIVCLNYSTYCHNPNLINDITLVMPNHYVEEILSNSTNKISFIDNIEDLLKDYIIFIKDGTVNLVNEAKDKNLKKNINLRLDEIKYLNLSGQKPLIVISKYLLALLHKLKIEQLEKEVDYETVFNILTEITITLYHQQLIKIIKTDYSKMRGDNLLIKSAHNLNNFYLQNEHIIIEKSFKGYSKEIVSMTKDEYLNLMKVFNLNVYCQNKNKKINPNAKVLSTTLDIEKCNMEHFIIDKNRYSNRSGKNSYLFNTILLDNDINSDFANKNIKTLDKKIEYLLNSSDFKLKEVEKNLLINYVQLIDRHIKENNSTSPNNLLHQLVIDEKKQLKKDDFQEYIDLLNPIMESILNEFLIELKEIKELLKNYDNSNVVFK